MNKRLVFAFIGFLASAFIGNNSYAAVFFDSQQALDTNYKANTANLYDFNNDGKMDLITGDSSIGTISILLGNGDGTFQKIAENNFGSLSFVVGDFNNDGKMDIATINNDWDYGWFTIYLGNGDGTFQYNGYYKDWSGGISTIITGDFNGDGIVDFATLGGWFYFTVYLGNGDGTFQAASRYGTGIYPSQIIHRDLNNDGKEDIIVVNTDYNGPSISIYLGNGDGTFQAAPTIFLEAWSLTSGDYNGDGKIDLAVTSGAGVSILLGNGDGTFRNNANYPISGTISTGDANGDGIPDLIIQNGGILSVLLGDGNGTFPVQVKDDITGSLLAISDFNHDGRADIAFVNSLGNLSTLFNNYGGEPLGNIVINNDDISTNSTNVTLILHAIDDRGAVSQMRFSNDEGATWSVWESYVTSKIWILTSGYGTKSVCVQFRDTDNKVSPSSCDTIYLNPTTPSEVVRMIEDMVARGEISDSGVINAVVSLLNKAQVQYENDRAATKKMLIAAVNILEAQSGWRKNIDWQAAQKLVEYLNNIIKNL